MSELKKGETEGFSLVSAKGCVVAHQCMEGANIKLSLYTVLTEDKEGPSLISFVLRYTDLCFSYWSINTLGPLPG